MLAAPQLSGRQTLYAQSWTLGKRLTQERKDNASEFSLQPQLGEECGERLSENDLVDPWESVMGGATCSPGAEMQGSPVAIAQTSGAALSCPTVCEVGGA